MSDTIRMRKQYRPVTNIKEDNSPLPVNAATRPRRIKLGTLRRYIRSIELFKEGTTR